MPNWKKVIVSGSDAALNSLFATTHVSASNIYISSSGTEQLRIIGSGSTDPLLTVQGSQGLLWSVTDSLTGSLFSVGDISGTSQFEVFSDGDIFTGDQGSYQTLLRTSRIPSSQINVTESVTTISTSSYDGAFFDYVVVSASNARVGTIMGVWNGGTVAFTETTSSHIGNTSPCSFNIGITGSRVALQSVTTTGGWDIKSTIRII